MVTYYGKRSQIYGNVDAALQLFFFQVRCTAPHPTSPESPLSKLSPHLRLRAESPGREVRSIIDQEPLERTFGRN
jgi:hypothetical protein